MQVDKNSMILWWDKIKDLPIPMPKTEIYIIPEKYYPRIWISERAVVNMIKECLDEIKVIAERIGYPLFLRTDLASAKHGWKNTCYVPCEEELADHIFNVIEFNLIADIRGLPYRALVLREYIEMNSIFTAFYGELPINPERRYLIRDGRVIAHFPYWIEDAIARGTPTNRLPADWKELLKQINKESEEEVKLLTEYSCMVAKIFPDEFWSIDYCQAKNGTWYLIDMARGERSWIPEHIKRKIVK